MLPRTKPVQKTATACYWVTTRDCWRTSYLPTGCVLAPPVLAGAQVSLAMGGGTQLAHASADMVLLSEQLPHLVTAIRTSRRTLAVIRQNLAWALVYNMVALPLAAAGWIAPWMAAIGMSTSSLVVVVNALRLRNLPSE